MDAPVAVMETAGEGGPWGMALLASYMVHKAEGETLELRKAGAISDSILIFAMESTDEGRITIDLVNGKIYLYPIVGMQDVIFNFGEPRLVANSIDDFFDNLVFWTGTKQFQQ